tara:strand:- start:541 stop:684 length:144 start_codon:yes stop_codon:yes gene_type:complete
MKLPLNQFNDYLKVIPQILDSERGTSSDSHDNRSYVESQMRRLHGSK